MSTPTGQLPAPPKWRIVQDAIKGGERALNELYLWYTAIHKLLSTSAGLAWAIVNKAGSSIADLEDHSHSSLSGLGGDDHTQYHTDSRGDARYEAKNANIQAHIGITAGNPHGTTAAQVGAYTKAETDSGFAPIAHMSDTTTHGTTGDIVGTTDAQQITNKKYGGATHYSEFEGDGTLIAHGNARVWKDIDIDLSAQTSGGSVPALIAVNSDPYIQARAFAGTGATVEQLGGSKELIHEMVFGEDIIPHVHWAPTTAAAGDVKWQLRTMLVNRGGVYTGGATTSVTTPSPGVAWQGLRSDFPPISTVGLQAGARVMFTLFRDPADAADTYGAAVIAPNFGVHVPVDMLGTRTVDDK